MKFFDLLMLANRNLWRRKGRTLLTVLGMTIGTIAIVVMFSLGIGLAQSTRESMEEWGSLNIITVHQSFAYPGMPEDQQERSKLLNDAAITEIEALPGVLGVSPSFIVHGEARRGREKGHITLIGIEPEMMNLLEFEAMAGRLLDNQDRFNVVAGSFVIDTFMEMGASMNQPVLGVQSNRDPTELLHSRIVFTLQSGHGQKRRYTLNVVGILDPQLMEHAHSVYAPLSVVRQMHGFMNRGMQQEQFQAGLPGTAGQLIDEEIIMRPKRQELQYNSALVRTKDVETTKRLLSELRTMGFQASSVAEGLEGIEQGVRIVQAVLGGIGGISLLVAAIGIINTMVMSIYERTREIAIIKVLGASFSNIRWLFLAESSLIGFLGGSAGIALSYLISFVINIYAGAFIGAGTTPAAEPIRISLIPLWLTGFSLVFGLIIGLLAGLYPAARAMKLDPVTAMRHY